jgi:hypothetical protein
MGRRLAPLLFLAACGGTPPADPPPPPTAPPFRHQAFFDTVRAEADGFGFRDGDWLEDLGDAPFYGLAFFAHRLHDDGDAVVADRVAGARARARTLITDVDFMTADLQEVTMSSLGLVEFIAASGDRGDLPTLDAFVDQIDTLVGAIGYYVLPAVADSWALRTYGSTAISALIGLVNTEYALRVGGERAQDRIAWAVEMGRRIDEEAWDGSAYAFGPDRDGLFDYPNIAMMILNARLFELTQNAAYRDRALASYHALQALKLSTDPTRYSSPYLAEELGAQSNDISTLSSQDYLMFGLALLWEVTREPAFVSELDSMLDALEELFQGQWCLAQVHHEMCMPACTATEACVVDTCAADQCQGGVLHHFIDGHQAQPSDPVLFCSGCNLQLLFVMWYRSHRL